MANRDLHPRGRNPKRVLAVRMLVAKIAWLDAPLIWYNGRVCWKTQEALFTPTPADLARAQYTLYNISRYPISAEIALQDREAWVAERASRLEHAKLLCRLDVPDLTTFARSANARIPGAVDQLVRLLIAEAFCLNDLPVSPVQMLVAWGEAAEPSLQQFVAETENPLEARALAALALGTLHHKRSVPSWQIATSAEDERIRCAYRWGRSQGLPSDPCLSLALLADVAGEELTHRYEQAISRQLHLAFPVQTLREMFYGGATPVQIVELVEALAEAKPLMQRILAYLKIRNGVSPPLATTQRQEILAALQTIYVASAQHTLDARVVRLITDFVAVMFEHFHLDELADAMLRLPNRLDTKRSERPGIVDVVLSPLKDGLKLPSSLLHPYLELLLDRHESLWPPKEIPTNQAPREWEWEVVRWAQHRWESSSKRIRTVLQGSQDVALVREAMDQQLLGQLSHYAWKEPGMYRFAIVCNRVYSETNSERVKRILCSRIDQLGSAAQARAALQPLLLSLRSVPSMLQQSLLSEFLDQVPHTRAALSMMLPQLARYVPIFDWYTKRGRGRTVGLECCVAALLALHAKLREETESWFRTLLTCLLDLEHEGTDLIHEQSVGLAALLAATLAQGDQNHFQVIFRALVRRSIQQDMDRLKRGVETLEKYPILLHPLAVIFPQQPERCAMLLMRVGLAIRLGVEALTPLTALNPESQESDSEQPATLAEGDWGELLALLPEFTALVAGFRHAQKLLSRSDAMPAGVRRALELPRRMARELDFLERSSESGSPKPELQARRARLQEMLARPEEIVEAVRMDVGKRLDQATALAQIDAAEQQLLLCYRNRLEAVAGSLPPDLEFDVNLQNATLLTADIEQNRRLLQRLLRAHIEGRAHWREAHPANAAFLQKLAAQGVDTVVWLGAHPRRYPCVHAAGRRVRLHLEQDPLHILQMGNYFDTCLSFGGFNAFSTVANACELNKRVVYAADGMGRIVGRKLIGINAEGELIGFHTYTSLTDEEGNRELIAIFRRYLGLFALRSGLKLASTGTIPTLFAEDWYDDGAVDWENEEPLPFPYKPTLHAVETRNLR